jgi:hypothetical protein
MKASYDEDLASHTDPESCTVVREDGCGTGLLAPTLGLPESRQAVWYWRRPHPAPTLLRPWCRRCAARQQEGAGRKAPGQCRFILLSNS